MRFWWNPERLTLGELEARAGTRLTWLFPFLHPRVAGEVAEWLDELAVLRVHLRERTGNRMADRDRLGLLAATLNDHVEVELVGERNGEERREHGVLKLDGR